MPPYSDDASAPAQSAADGAPERLPGSLRAFLNHLVDYAGLFPPAQLPLREALQNYARYRQEPEAWMLARFVLPVRRLVDLDEYANLFSEDARRPRGPAPPYRFSALGTGGATAGAFLEHFEDDLAALDAFHDRRQGRAVADAMEVRLPSALHDADAGALAGFFADVHRALVMAGTSELDLFFEVPLGEGAARRVSTAAQAAADHNARQERPLRAEVGLKFRCGGDAPSDFPPPVALARGIAACRDAGTCFKFTAGLHAPVRHYDEEIGAWHHGFLNAFSAAVFAQAHDFGVEALQKILLEENADRFQFTPGALAWRTLQASVEDIHDAREHFALSVGSCSFEEPIEHLEGLGLL